MGETVHKLSVSASEDRERLDVFLAHALPPLTRTRAAALVGDGLVLVDRKTVKPAHRVRTGERVDVRIPDPESSEVIAQSIALDVLYEDEHLIVVNKPPGMVVHPAPGHHDGTLVNALLAHARDLSGIGGVLRPGIVHRLDKGTSGLIVCAKNDRAHQALAKAFAGRTVRKEYLAVTLGVPSPRRGRIERPIGRHPVRRKTMSVDVPRSRSAVTDYRVLGDHDGLALVACRIHTGRTHQIRVHLTSIGCPILMDADYGGGRGARRLSPTARDAAAGLARPALHSWRLAFTHPVTGNPVELVAAPPADLAGLVAFLGGLK